MAKDKKRGDGQPGGTIGRPGFFNGGMPASFTRAQFRRLGHRHDRRLSDIVAVCEAGRNDEARENALATTAPDNLRRVARQYYEALFEQNYSPATIYARADYLQRFFEWADTRGVTDLAQVNQELIEHYQTAIFHYRKSNGEPMAIGTQVNCLSHLSGFFRWCTRKKLLLYNPAAEIELPRRGHRLPSHVLTIEEIEKVLGLVDTTAPKGLRDRAIIETLYSTGIRRLELVRLKLYDVDTERGTAFISQSKYQKDRLVPIGEQAVHWVKRYLTEVRPLHASSPDPGFIFVGSRGLPLDANTISCNIRKYLKEAGIRCSGSCHVFRHAMATHLLEHGVELRFIQEILGHANISTTEIYTHVSIQKLKEVHAAHHPRAKLPEEIPAKTKPRRRLRIVAG